MNSKRTFYGPLTVVLDDTDSICFRDVRLLLNKLFLLRIRAFVFKDSVVN